MLSSVETIFGAGQRNMANLSDTGFTQGRIKSLLIRPVLRVRRCDSLSRLKVAEEADANSPITAQL